MQEKITLKSLLLVMRGSDSVIIADEKNVIYAGYIGNAFQFHNIENCLTHEVEDIHMSVTPKNIHSETVKNLDTYACKDVTFEICQHIKIK